MALILSHELKTGATGNYWSIIKGELNPVARYVKVNIALYKDQATKEARPDSYYPDSVLEYIFAGEEYAEFEPAIAGTGGSIIGIAYNKMRQSRMRSERVRSESGWFGMVETETNPLVGAQVLI